jgi:hypothetical protein
MYEGVEIAGLQVGEKGAKSGLMDSSVLASAGAGNRRWTQTFDPNIVQGRKTILQTIICGTPC